jgi:tetratricopeptide (TPR) repeat protein
MGYLIRSLGYRVQKHFFPKTMEAGRDLAQLDVASTNKKLIDLQQKQIQTENEHLSKLDGSNEELKQIKLMFAQYALKSYEQQEKIYEGIVQVEAGLKTINNSIHDSTNRIVGSLERSHTEIVELLKNRQMTDADALRRIGKQRLSAVVSSGLYSDEDLTEATEFYEKSVEDLVGKTNPLTWLELGHAYSISKKHTKAKRAYLKADRLSNQGDRILYDIRNEALYNVVLLILEDRNYESAYDYINRIVESNHPFDETILALKGVVELKLGQTEKGFNSVIACLNERPESIRDIYTFGAEGIIIDNSARANLVDKVCEAKRKEISLEKEKMDNLLSSFSNEISIYSDEKFRKTKGRFDEIYEGVKKITSNDYLSLYDVLKSLQNYKEKLMAQLIKITDRATNEQEKKCRVADYAVTRFIGYGSSIDAKTDNEMQEVWKGMMGFTSIASVLLFMILMFKLENDWYWRILIGGIIAFVLYWIVRLIFTQVYNSKWEEQNKDVTFTYEKLQSELNSENMKLQELNERTKVLKASES